MLIGACASGHEGGGGKAMEAGVARVVHAAASGICCCGRKRTAGSGSLQLPDSPVRNWGFYCVRKEAEDVCSRGNLAVGRWVWVRCGCDVGVVKNGWGGGEEAGVGCVEKRTDETKVCETERWWRESRRSRS